MTELQPTLEERVKQALTSVPSDAALKDHFIDAGDRQRVRRRALIAAALDAIFKHSTSKYAINEDGSIEVTPEADVLSELAYARLDYLHDQSMLDNGRPADLVLRQVGHDTIDQKQTIKANREILIYWLALFQLWDRKRDVGFANLDELLRYGASRTGRSADALAVARSHIEKGEKFSDCELTRYHDLIDQSREISRKGGNAISPFELLLPAVVGLTVAAYKPTATAASKS